MIGTATAADDEEVLGKKEDTDQMARIATAGEKVHDHIPDLTLCALDYPMASSSPSPLASSVEKTNGAKLRRLLIDGGTMVLRNIFDGYHPPANLQANLNANYGTLKNLLRRRVLHLRQWDLLFPPGKATADSNTFDITLLFVLLTSICGLSPPPTGWYTKPSAIDTSVEANLARIKFFRNELYGRITTTGMDTHTFSALWREIGAALVALGLPQADIDRLKAERCGEEDFLDVLFEWADSEEDIKSQLRDIRQYQAKSGQSFFEIATFGEKVNDDIPDLTSCTLDYGDGSPCKKTNAKLSRLLIDGGTMVLRKIFDRYHPPANLQANLNANYDTLNNLLRRRVLRQPQWYLLFPPGGATPKSNTFDMTLLFLLLKSICGLSPPPSGWHSKPSASDNSVEANLARITFFRNELYGHVTTTSMDTPTFSALWQEISAVLVALGLPQAEIDRLKAEHCGEEDFLGVLFEWADSEEDIKSQLKDIRQYQAKTGQTVVEVRQTQIEDQNTMQDIKEMVEQQDVLNLQSVAVTQETVDEKRQTQLGDRGTVRDNKVDTKLQEEVEVQREKNRENECRSKLIEHAVRCLTTERSTSVCVKRDHVARVWKQLHESGEAYKYFTEEDRREIEEAIGNWELLHDSQFQTRKPSDLRVCYLGGDNPINYLKVLVANGVLCQNVWAIVKDAKTLAKAWNAIKNSQWRNAKLFNGDILTFLRDFPGQFDIIYFDACGTLPAAKQNTLKVIGYVFLYDKLTSPGALITNFSFPPQETQQENSASSQGKREEREMINFLVKEYMKYRLCNVLVDDNSPESNAEYLSKRSNEDNYGDYVSYQVIDSAYSIIPAQRMLLSKGKSLRGQIFVDKQVFLQDIHSYFSSDGENATKGTKEKSTETTRYEKLAALREKLKNLKAFQVDTTERLFLYLKKMAENLSVHEQSNSLCKAWVAEIFPDWRAEPSLKKEKLPSMLLTPILSSSLTHIIRFCNDDSVSKCLGPLLKAIDENMVPSCCDLATPEQAIRLVVGLLYGQMAYPSFPVMDKLFRLRYTAKKRQMFADVFVFDKCRYLYDQFPTVDCACFAIEELKQQFLVRMVVDGLRKHLRGICKEDLFRFCHVANIDEIMKGEVSFSDSEGSIPERQKIEI
ncbi:PREDICTED: uncharacterized protein LOC107350903 isoform X2 [Acropora digitifera]|uniref:uncharacterized protein LOC107350903 isoform X2 n=1 Tax=Acropora digitifera TaxID=70779 RepID=UPI000779FCBC|nr:PREDICTED: uncharacterized protein LOC107350903 isoform X2 [Acropora digitifera]